MGSKLQVHIYDTEAEAQAAVDAINAGEGYPLANGHTSSYTQYHTGIVPGSYVIVADGVTRQYLTAETEIELQGDE